MNASLLQVLLGSFFSNTKTQVAKLFQIFPGFTKPTQEQRTEEEEYRMTFKENLNKITTLYHEVFDDPVECWAFVAYGDPCLPAFRKKL